MAKSLYVRRRTVIHTGIVRCCGESGSSATGAISSAARQFFQSWERRPEESITPMQLRPVNFPVEDGQFSGISRELSLRCLDFYHKDVETSHRKLTLDLGLVFIQTGMP